MIKNHSGFTLIEILISTTIIAALVLAIYNLIILTMQVTADNKFRVAAIMLADKKMEYIRNLPYASVGTTGGIPNGVIPDNETITQNNGAFSVNTLIQYFDDPFDGTEDGDPDDDLSNDYKIARIRVLWNGPFGQKNVTTFSKIAPKGMESDLGGGTLSVLVYNAALNPVEDASVHIENNLLAVPISVDAETNEYGRVNFPGAPESIEGYEITVTKTGYSTSSTTARTVENPNPTLINATVLQGQKTEVAFSIDLLSNLVIRVVAANLPENWQINTDGGTEAQINSRLAIDNSGNIYVVWQDYRSASASKIYAQKYDSSGDAQWPNPTTPTDVNIAPANNTVIPDILVDLAGNLYISWYDDAAGNKESYLVKKNSSDGSDLWGAEKKVNTLADAANQSYPRVALADNGTNSTTTIIWQDDRDGDNDVYMQQFNYSGSKQWPAELRVSSTTIADNTNQTEPVIAIDSSENICIAWTDDRNGNLDIYAEKFDRDGNLIWGDKRVNTDLIGSLDQYNPDIAVDSLDNLYFIWTDGRNGDKDVYMQKLDANGNALWAEDIVAHNLTDSTYQESPSIAINSSDIIYAVWTDERNGNQDIYAQKLNTDGIRLWTPEIRINIDGGTSTSAQYNPDITIAPATGEPYASWNDNRKDNWDIFATKFDTYGVETPLANIPINVIGMKKIGENPIIYKFNKNYMTGSGGRIDLTAIEWDSYAITLQSGYLAHTLLMSIPTQPIDLIPSGSEEVKLYLD